jgi:micrococcal nuclease
LIPLILRARFTPAVSLLLFVVAAAVGSTAAVANAQAVAPGPRVTLGGDPKSRYIRLGGPGSPVYPTIDLTCDGKRWTLALTRSDDGAVYAVSRGNVQTMMSALTCRLLLPDQELALTRQQLWAAWSDPTQGAGAPQVLVGQVVDIIDGSTILVNMGERSETVRYIGIAPQASTRRPPGAEPSPGEAVEANRQLVSRQQVRLELDTQERDREGRLLAYVYVADRMVNAELVRRGSAEVMTVPPNVRHRDLFVTLEQEARDNRRGVWADPAEATTPTTVEPVLRQVAEGRRGVPPESTWACPAQQPIKGQQTSYIGAGRCVYHVPDGELYSATKAERCYASVEEARQDGCVAARR